MSSQNYIPYAELPDKLGLKSGDTVMLASDITRLAMTAIRNEGHFNADFLIDAFLHKLGPEGTLIIPSFNFNLKNNASYDPVTRAPVTGTLAEKALKRKDFSRTIHPLHSFLVSGKYASALLKMTNISSFGTDSPFAFFKETNCLMIMVGTSVTESFTFVHHVEEQEQVRYRRYRTIRLEYLLGDGRQEWREYRIYAKRPGWTMNLSLLEGLFRKKGTLTQITINGVACSRIRLGEAYPIILDDITQNRARSISRFDLKLFMKEMLKNTLSSLHLYRTLTEKISHGPGPR